MIKQLIAVLVLIFGLLIITYFFIGVPPVYKQELPKSKTPHLYKNPDVPLNKIKIAAFYFVPKNKTDFLIENWKTLLDKNLQKLQAFHDLQFQGKSQISYEIYPEAIRGLEDNQFYDTDITQYGNPQGLRNVASEIEKRFSDFLQKEKDSYFSTVIMYEGVAASGSENVAFISSTYLADPKFKEFGTSILAHEFYHSIGIPDAYEVPTSIPTSPDIMGLGRFRPIEKTYLARETLKALGL